MPQGKAWPHALHHCLSLTVHMICFVSYLRSLNRFIWLEDNYWLDSSNYYVKLDVLTSIRGLRQKKLVLGSSGS